MSPHDSELFPAVGTVEYMDKVISMRRWMQQRGRADLATGTVIGYFWHEGHTIGIAKQSTNVLRVGACEGPIPGGFDRCMRLNVQPIGVINHRWDNVFKWDDEVAAYFDDTGQVARKGADAYYHVLKGEALDPDDHIVINPAPQWIEIDVEAT
jgi:hypothetical protein